jgi:hypothetical protein
MKKSMNLFIMGMVLVLPASSFAGEVKPVAKEEVKKEEVKKEEVKKEEIKSEVKEAKDKDVKADHAEFVLDGAKEENTAQIVKLAKDAGASKASFNTKKQHPYIVG